MSADTLLCDSGQSPCHAVLPLDVFFSPASVAIFGGSEEPGSPQRTLMLNLIRNPFGGVLYPISSRHSLLGIEAYPDVAAVPEPIELAIVMTPAPEVPAVLVQCAATGVKAALVLSPGSGGDAPASWGKGRYGSMRILGPNSHGIACPRTGLNATFSPTLIRPGNVGLLSQDGDLLTASLGQQHAEHAGCSVFVSLGSATDVGWAEWIDYLDGDAQTECIGIYLETLADPRAFFAAVREVAARKPVLLVKGGDSDSARQGSPRDEVFDEACRCSGVLRVRRMADLFRMAHLLTTQPPSRGRRPAILTNVHGPGVLAADRLHAIGGRPAPLASETVLALRQVLPPGWNGQNPIEVGANAGPEQLARAAGIVLRDPGTDAVFVLLSPQAGLDAVRAAEELKNAVQHRTKPILACWLWAAGNPQSLAVLREADIPVFGSPEAAINAFDDLCRHAENLRFLSDVTAALREVGQPEPASPHPIGLISQARRCNHAELSREDWQQLFAAYSLPVLETRIVPNDAEAVAAAEAMEYPVQLSFANEPWLSVKDRVCLKAVGASDVRRAVRTLRLVAREHFGVEEPVVVTVQPTVTTETCLAAVRVFPHPHLGPVIEFGEFEVLGHAPHHPVTTLPLLTPVMARELIGQSPALATLHSQARGLNALVDFLVNLGRLVVEQTGIKEIGISPLLVAVDRVLVLDARVVLHPPDSTE